MLSNLNAQMLQVEVCVDPVQPQQINFLFVIPPIF